MKDWWRKLNKFSGLSLEEKRLFFKAAYNLIHITLALKILKFPSFKNYYRRICKTRTKSETEEMYKTAIKTFSAISPKTYTCLPQALVFKKQFSNSKLIIGIQPNKTTQLDAHAWVERDGKFLIGDMPNFEYLPLWVWE